MRLPLLLLTTTTFVAAQPGDPVPLSTATVVATHLGGADSPVANVTDGDEATCWAGDGHDLAKLPTNIIVTLPQTTPVGSLAVLTQVLKDRLRLTDLEVYARVGEGWALLGAARENREVRFTVDLTPAEVTQLRLRVLNTARPDRAFPRINELQLFAPRPGAELAELQPGEAPNESRGERLYLDYALGGGDLMEKAEFDPEKGYLHYARTCLDTLFDRGTDRYGDTHSAMLVSILDCATHEHPNCEIPPILGQRPEDRALFGGNLQHDVMLLRACEYLSDMTGEARYREAARAYLGAFLRHCTHSATGLWAWGEHAHWDFYREAPGHTTHEYLGAPPPWFWEPAWQTDREAVVREADGLINHVVSLETFDYNRHADITKVLPDPRLPDAGFLDFPRHGGFYIQVWAFTYSKTREPRYLDRIERMMDHHVAARHAESGLIPSTTTRDAATHVVMTQLSLALSMLESVPLLGQSDTAARCDRLGREYLEACARLPHRPDEALFVPGCPVGGPKTEEEAGLTAPAFAAHYGGTFLATDALLWTQAYRLTGEERYLILASAIARFYRDAEGVPAGANTPAHVYGSLVDLMLDMHELVGGDEWPAAAERYARQGIEDLYCNGLFRGATGLWHYESESWVSTFIYSLVRLHSVLARSPVAAEPNYFHR